MKALTVTLALAIIASSCASAQDAAPTGPATANAANGALDEQRHEGGAVTIMASWTFGTMPAVRVAMDTHSLDLDGFDLQRLARVRIDGGPWIAPSGWDAPAGGHHRAGMLTFGSLDAKTLASARVVELEVRDVAVPSHLLRWERPR